VELEVEVEIREKTSNQFHRPSDKKKETLLILSQKGFKAVP
jgi:hypothetical protein